MVLVAAGILLSRLAGLARQRIFAHYFGLVSEAADAFNVALRIPNFLQNLFGEGVLSASFIPVYSKLLGRNEEEQATEVAGTIGTLLFLVSAVLVLLGVLATPMMVSFIAPGFEGEKRELTIRLVKILFPATGLLVMSAWCLGILNSHRKFFLSYAAPVIWNFAIIAAILIFASPDLEQLAEYTAWGVVIGSFLQFIVQLPTTWKLLKRIHFGVSWKLQPVRQVLRSFVPVVIGRGVVQLSAFIDSQLSSLLPTGAVTGLANSQSIYMLPVSLFGMSISAAELPTMSRAHGSKEEIAAFLQERITRALHQVAFFIVPSATGFWLLGDVVVQVLYQTGRFSHEDSLYVWAILAGSTVGLLAGTQGRLYSSAFYSLQNTRTPLNYALVRVCLTAALGWLCGVKLPGWIGISEEWGAVGLTASAGFAAWLEFLLLRRGIDEIIGKTRLQFKFMLKAWAVALTAGAFCRVLKHLLGNEHPFAAGILILSLFVVFYLGVTAFFGLEQSKRMIQRARGFLPF